MQRIAVAIVHGIEIDDPHFAATPTKLLKEGFAEAVGPSGPDPDDALVIEPIHWAPDAQARQQALFDRVFETETTEYFNTQIADVIRGLNTGSTRQLVPLAFSAARRTSGDLDRLHWPTARWLLMHFIGDVIAYERDDDDGNYDAVHQTFAAGLGALARKAGREAPLCVIAHSFGSVLASDYFYDQQQPPGRRLVSADVREARGPSPLAKGRTLAWFYTMGSPLALWSLRYPKATLDRPIEFPGAKVPARYPDLEGEWVNFYDKDDLAAYPLGVLSEEYAATVTDRDVTVRGLPISMTPLVHPFYWSDGPIMDSIARSLAAGWQQVN